MMNETNTNNTESTRKTPIGIANLGNTCFLNSCLQILYQCPSLDHILDSPSILNKERPDAHVFKHWHEIRTGTRQHTQSTTVYPRGLLNAVKYVATKKQVDTFASHEQNDFSEFLLFFMECLHQSISRPVQISIGGNPVNNTDKMAMCCYNMLKEQYDTDYSELYDVFYGISVTRIHSLQNDSIIHSVRPEQFFVLDLPVQSHDKTILDCLDHHTESEIMEGENAWHNDETNAKEDIRKTLAFFKLPQILFICLKRFSFDHRSRKNNDLIEFPETIHMQKYYCGYQASKQNYQLKAVCYHIGSMNYGHYTATVKQHNTGQWFYCDDERITPTDLPTVLRTLNHVYCVVYERI
jgi:ubiquitin C-terminal hydrolase